MNQRIINLQQIIDNANLHTSIGRQQVARACSELYDIIEDNLKTDILTTLNTAYCDLREGNFSNPNAAAIKKYVFTQYVNKLQCITSKK